MIQVYIESLLQLIKYFYFQGNKSSTESINIIAEMGSRSSMKSKSKSSQSLREIGLNDYPNPKMPASVKLTRKEEKFSLQNLNNRLAGMKNQLL